MARHPGADVALEATDSLAGQSAKDAVRAPFVVTELPQFLLDPDPVRSGHTGLVGHGRQERTSWRC